MTITSAYPVLPLPSNNPRSGLIWLRNWVEAYLKEAAIPAIVAPVGLKYRSFSNQYSPGGAGRVVFIPGEFDGGLDLAPRKYGTLSRSTRNATSASNPRELAIWEQPFTLSVWAADPTSDAGDEQSALEAVETLLEQTVRACNSLGAIDKDTGLIKSASAAVSWGPVTLNAPPSESAFGLELLVQCTLRTLLFDVTLETTQATGVPGRGSLT